MRTFLLVAVAFTVAPIAAAADATLLRGRVVDGASGAPLTGVEVTASRDGLERADTTDDHGDFLLPALPAGAYRVTFDRRGFEWVEVVDLELVPGATVVVRIVLHPTEADQVVLLTGGPAVDAASTVVTVPSPAELGAAREGIAPPALVPASPDLGVRHPLRPPASAVLGAPASATRRVLDGGDVTGLVHGLPPLPASSGAAADRLEVGGWPPAAAGAPGGVRLLASDAGAAPGGEVDLVVARGDGAGAETASTLDRSGAGEIAGRAAVRIGRLGGPRLVLVAGSSDAALDLGTGRAIDSQEMERRSRTTDALARLGWAASRANLGLTVGATDLAVDGDRSSLDLGMPAGHGASLPPADPRFDADADTAAAVARADVLVAGGWLEGAASWFRERGEFEPRSETASYRDLTGDGLFSGGIGGGALLGGASFRRHRDRFERSAVRLALALPPVRRHELSIGAEVADESFRRRRGPVDGEVCAPLAAGAVRRLAGGVTAPLGPVCDADGDGITDGVRVPFGAGADVRVRVDTGLVGVRQATRVAGDAARGAAWMADIWRPSPSVTVHVGVRGEWHRISSAGRKLRLDLGELLLPRVGVAWDPGGRGHSRLFVHAGRFHRAIPLDPAARLVASDDLTGWLLATAGAAPVPQAPGEVVELRPPAAVEMDDALHPPRVDELVAGAETELLAGVVVGGAVIARRWRDGIARVSTDGGASFLLTNPEAVGGPALERDELLVRVAGSARFGRSRVDAILAWGRLDGTDEGYRGTSIRRADAAWWPDLILPEQSLPSGPLATDRRRQAVLSGRWPLGLGTVAALLAYQSGAPTPRLGTVGFDLDRRFVGGRAAGGRSPDLWRVDARLEWPLGRGVVGAVEVTNLLDDRGTLVLRRRWTVSPDDDARTETTWGDPLLEQLPRELRLGVTYRW